MLIIDGTDLVGKTTLQLALLKRLQSVGPWIGAHFTRLPKMWAFPNDYFPRMSRHVVQDRFHMSEVAYSTARGDETSLSPFKYSLVDARLRQLGGLTVVITADEDFIRSQWRSCNDGQMYDLDTVLRANRAFSEIVSNHTDYKVDVDYVMATPMGAGYPAQRHGLIDDIIDRYMVRQAVLDGVLRHGTVC